MRLSPSSERNVFLTEALLVRAPFADGMPASVERDAPARGCRIPAVRSPRGWVPRAGRATRRNVPRARSPPSEARAQQEDYQVLLTRYANERLLFRLSVSSHANRFVLKGAALFAIWTGTMHRAMRDLDLLGFVAPDARPSSVRSWPRCSISTSQRPDIVLRDRTSGRSLLVVDAKWKAIGDGGPGDDDLKQMFVYNHLLGTEQSVLVYPSAGVGWQALAGEYS